MNPYKLWQIVSHSNNIHTSGLTHARTCIGKREGRLEFHQVHRKRADFKKITVEWARERVQWSRATFAKDPSSSPSTYTRWYYCSCSSKWLLNLPPHRQWPSRVLALRQTHTQNFKRKLLLLLLFLKNAVSQEQLSKITKVCLKLSELQLIGVLKQFLKKQEN